MRTLIAVAVLIVGVALLAACSTGNEAKSFMPEASELCCHSNWKILSIGQEREEGACPTWFEEEFGKPQACWLRLYYNEKIRPGEPTDLTVHVAIMTSEPAAQLWLSSYAPTGGFDPSEYGPMRSPLVGDGARAWDYSSEYGRGTEAAFYRENVSVIVWVDEGTAEERQIMVESVDEAILDRLFGYR